MKKEVGYRNKPEITQNENGEKDFSITVLSSTSQQNIKQRARDGRVICRNA
jgi:hypothetical protein